MLYTWSYVSRTPNALPSSAAAAAAAVVAPLVPPPTLPVYARRCGSLSQSDLLRSSPFIPFPSSIVARRPRLYRRPPPHVSSIPVRATLFSRNPFSPIDHLPRPLKPHSQSSSSSECRLYLGCFLFFFFLTIFVYRNYFFFKKNFKNTKPKTDRHRNPGTRKRSPKQQQRLRRA